MKVAEVSELSSLERFLYWIEERHNIYLKRERGEKKPWTDDEILQQYFFTNPYRENDKVTVWFRENVRDYLRDVSSVLLATVIFRWFNWIPTGELLLDHNLLEEWKLREAKKVLKTQQAEKGKVFTGAFNISNSGSTKPKIDRVCDDHIQPMWKDRTKLQRAVASCNTMEAAHGCLKPYLGMGGSGFMAYEVVCDLRYTDFFRIGRDRLKWCNPGPGCIRGLNRLLDNEVSTRKPANWKTSMRWYREIVDQHMRQRGYPPVEMREIEHSLCEYDKYERARLKDGRMKRKYNGSS